MRVIITAGGTGGHIYPALAILNKIKEEEPDSEFLYIGTHNRMESEIVPKQGIEYVPLEIYGLSTSIKLMPRNIKNIFLIQSSYQKCLKLMKSFKPDIVIGVGGYVTYPVIKAAHHLNIKTFIHEQNSIPGKANKSLLKWTTVVGISIPESRKYLKHNNIVLTGNPVAERALKSPKISKTKYGLSANKKAVLIFSGSLGSKAINDLLDDYLKSAEKLNYEILYITGKNYFEQFKSKNYPKNVFIEPYVDNLSGLMKDMDLIISRAGASSIAEIEALLVPTIFIPSPYVPNNHQYYNALSIVNNNAGDMIEEKDLNTEVLMTKIDAILNDKEKQKTIKENLRKLNIHDSATIIYNEIKKII